MPDLSLEQKIGDRVAGVDEAGRGPLSGPVVAAALIFTSNDIPEGINDSKKLSQKKREFLFERLYEVADIGVSIIEPAVIDEINILNATKKAMCEAIAQITPAPEHVLIDGNQLPKQLALPATPVIKGDSISLSIAAASIIAKVTRDRIMAQLHEEFPYYGWSTNSGYGTKEHLAGIEQHGITKHHRKSFAPVKTMLAAG